MEAYRYLSQVYDKLMSDVDYSKWAEYIHNFLKKYNVRSIFEVASGTGNVTNELYRLGYDIIASDVSSEMLNIANGNAKIHGNDVKFVLQDMRHIETGNKVDAVVSVCDGPNYTDAQGLKEFAASSYNALKENGVLLFDISTRNKLAGMDGEVYFDDGEDASCIWQNTYDKNRKELIMDVTLFIRNGKTFERYTERHKQYAHDTADVLSIISAAGYKYADVFECFTYKELKEDSQRAQFICIKK